MREEFWALTRTIDTVSDPYWNSEATVFGTPEQIKSMVDLSRGVPHGWRLYKGKAAWRFMKRALKEEMRWAREQAAKRKSGGLN